MVGFLGLERKLPGGGVGEGLESAAGELPLSHRLSIVYLAAPVVVWLVGWFEWWVGLPMAALLAAGLWGALSGSWRMSLSLPILVSLLAALAWVLVIPSSGLWEFNGDLGTHFAVLLDMGRGGWPTYFTDYVSDFPPLLTYYTGLHMVPALVGRLLGSATLSWAFPLYIWIGIGLFFCMFIRGLSSLRAALIAIAIFVVFSGMDALEVVFHVGPQNALDILKSGTDIERFPHYNSEEGLYPYYFPPSYFLWYAPQHFIASGLVSLIIIQSRHQPRFKAVSGLVIAICLFWSPMGAVGLLPLAIVLFAKKKVRAFLKWPNLLITPPLIGLIALHINSDATFRFRWLWQHYNDITQMLIDLMLVYLLEFVLLAFVLWRIDRHIIKNPAFIVSIAVLIVAPWFIYQLYFHYIMTRGTVPVLVVLAYLTTRVVISVLPEMTNSNQTIFPLTVVKVGVMYTILIAILAIGGLTTLRGFLRSDNHPNAVYKRLERTLFVHEWPQFVTERSTIKVPDFYQQLLRKHDQKGLSIGDPIINSKYDIYWQKDDNSLVYLNRDCLRLSEENTRFFLHIYPSDGADLPLDLGYEVREPNDGGYLPLDFEQAGYEIREVEWRHIYNWRPYRGEYYEGAYACILIFGLPDYSINRIVTGQYTPYLGIEWSAEYRFDVLDQNSSSQIHKFDPTDKYQGLLYYYQLATAAEPLIRSDFHIHLFQLHTNIMVYTKDDCISPALPAPFFLHIIPANTEDLPAQRRQIGFDNYDFEFDNQGVVFDDKCLAIVHLPDYDIAAIRTGQWNPDDGRRLWQEEVAFDQ